MKILLIGPTPPPLGGATVLFQELVDSLSSRSDVEVFLVRTSGRKTQMKIFGVLYDILRLAKRVDVISFHGSVNSFLAYGNAIKFISWLFNKPYIARCFGGSLLQKYRTSYLVRFGTRMLLRSNTIILLEAKLLVRYFRRISENPEIHWFPNSRGLRKKPSHKKPGLTPFAFVFAGHIRPDKGVRDLLSAAKQLENDPIEVHIYGGQQSAIKDVEFASKNVRFLGEVGSDEILQVLSNADALVLPTYYDGECYPGVIIEAFSLGKPVVSTKWKFIPELVREGTNGMLVAPRTPHDLAKAMRNVATDAKLYTRLSKGAFQSAQKYNAEYWNNTFFTSLCSEAANRNTHNE